MLWVQDASRRQGKKREPPLHVYLGFRYFLRATYYYLFIIYWFLQATRIGLDGVAEDYPSWQVSLSNPDGPAFPFFGVSFATPPDGPAWRTFNPMDLPGVPLTRFFCCFGSLAPWLFKRRAYFFPYNLEIKYIPIYSDIFRWCYFMLSLSLMCTVAARFYMVLLHAFPVFDVAARFCMVLLVDLAIYATRPRRGRRIAN